MQTIFSKQTDGYNFHARLTCFINLQANPHQSRHKLRRTSLRILQPGVTSDIKIFIVAHIYIYIYLRNRRLDPPASIELNNSVLESFFLLGCHSVRPVRNVSSFRETCYFHIQRRRHTRVTELSVRNNENKFTIRLRSACITRTLAATQFRKFLLKFSYLDTKHTINLPAVCMNIELGLS